MNRCLITNAIAGFRKTKIAKSWVRNSSDVHLPKKMRILISGASGLVGQALIPVLQQSGHQVCALTTRKDTVAFSNDVPAHYWNPEKGIFVTESHYAVNILDEMQFDSIYHEHLHYFTIKTISKLFAKFELYPYNVFKSPISGGSLVIYFSKNENVFNIRDMPIFSSCS